MKCASTSYRVITFFCLLTFLLPSTPIAYGFASSPEAGPSANNGSTGTPGGGSGPAGPGPGQGGGQGGAPSGSGSGSNSTGSSGSGTGGGYSSGYGAGDYSYSSGGSYGGNSSGNTGFEGSPEANPGAFGGGGGSGGSYGGNSSGNTGFEGSPEANPGAYGGGGSSQSQQSQESMWSGVRSAIGGLFDSFSFADNDSSNAAADRSTLDSVRSSLSSAFDSVTNALGFGDDEAETETTSINTLSQPAFGMPQTFDIPDTFSRTSPVGTTDRTGQQIATPVSWGFVSDDTAAVYSNSVGSTLSIDPLSGSGTVVDSSGAIQGYVSSEEVSSMISSEGTFNNISSKEPAHSFENDYTSALSTADFNSRFSGTGGLSDANFVSRSASGVPTTEAAETEQTTFEMPSLGALLGYFGPALDAAPLSSAVTTQNTTEESETEDSAYQAPQTFAEQVAEYSRAREVADMTAQKNSLESQLAAQEEAIDYTLSLDWGNVTQADRAAITATQAEIDAIDARVEATLDPTIQNRVEADTIQNKANEVRGIANELAEAERTNDYALAEQKTQELSNTLSYYDTEISRVQNPTNISEALANLRDQETTARSEVRGAVVEVTPTDFAYEDNPSALTTHNIANDAVDTLTALGFSPEHAVAARDFFNGLFSFMPGYETAKHTLDTMDLNTLAENVAPAVRSAFGSDGPAAGNAPPATEAMDEAAQYAEFGRNFDLGNLAAERSVVEAQIQALDAEIAVGRMSGARDMTSRTPEEQAQMDALTDQLDQIDEEASRITNQQPQPSLHSEVTAMRDASARSRNISIAVDVASLAGAGLIGRGIRGMQQTMARAAIDKSTIATTRSGSTVTVQNIGTVTGNASGRLGSAVPDTVSTANRAALPGNTTVSGRATGQLGSKTETTVAYDSVADTVTVTSRKTAPDVYTGRVTYDIPTTAPARTADDVVDTTTANAGRTTSNVTDTTVPTGAARTVDDVVSTPVGTAVNTVDDAVEATANTAARTTDNVTDTTVPASAARTVDDAVDAADNVVDLNSRRTAANTANDVVDTTADTAARTTDNVVDLNSRRTAVGAANNVVDTPVVTAVVNGRSVVNSSVPASTVSTSRRTISSILAAAELLSATPRMAVNVADDIARTAMTRAADDVVTAPSITMRNAGTLADDAARTLTTPEPVGYRTTFNYSTRTTTQTPVYMSVTPNQTMVESYHAVTDPLSPVEARALGAGSELSPADRTALGQIAAGELSPETRGEITRSGGDPAQMSEPALQEVAGVFGVLETRAKTRDKTLAEEANRSYVRNDGGSTWMYESMGNGSAPSNYAASPQGYDRIAREYEAGTLSDDMNVDAPLVDDWSDHFFNPTVVKPRWTRDLDTTQHLAYNPTTDSYHIYGNSRYLYNPDTFETLPQPDVPQTPATLQPAEPQVAAVDPGSIFDRAFTALTAPFNRTAGVLDRIIGGRTAEAPAPRAEEPATRTQAEEPAAATERAAEPTRTITKDSSPTEVANFFENGVRNPAGATVIGEDRQVRPKLVHASAMGVEAYEAANPNHLVRIYGSHSGVRTSGSTRNHGIQSDGHGGALDFAIYDKTTGRKLTNHSYSNHHGQLTPGEAAPHYQRLFNDIVTAAYHLDPDFAKQLRFGGYFLSSNSLDLMHVDVRSFDPHAGGTTLGGYNADQIANHGITDNAPLNSWDNVARLATDRYEGSGAQVAQAGSGNGGQQTPPTDASTAPADSTPARGTDGGTAPVDTIDQPVVVAGVSPDTAPAVQIDPPPGMPPTDTGSVGPGRPGQPDEPEPRSNFTLAALGALLAQFMLTAVGLGDQADAVVEQFATLPDGDLTDNRTTPTNPASPGRAGNPGGSNPGGGNGDSSGSRTPTFTDEETVFKPAATSSPYLKEETAHVLVQVDERGDTYFDIEGVTHRDGYFESASVYSYEDAQGGTGEEHVMFDETGNVIYSDGTYAPSSEDPVATEGVNYVYRIQQIENGVVVVEEMQTDLNNSQLLYAWYGAELSTYTLDDVASVTYKYVDPDTTTPENEYYEYTITLTDGTIHYFVIPRLTNVDFFIRQLADTGYTGDVVAFIELGVEIERTEFTPPPTLFERLIDGIRNGVARVTAFLVGEDVPNEQYTEFTELSSDTGRTAAEDRALDTDSIKAVYVYVDVPAPCAADASRPVYVYEMVIDVPNVGQDGVLYNAVCGSGTAISYANTIASDVSARGYFTSLTGESILDKLLFRFYDKRTGPGSDEEVIPNTTNEITFEAKVTRYGGTVTDWTTGMLDVREGDQLYLRWNAENYQRCLPFIGDNGAYSLSRNDLRLLQGNTEAEGYDLNEHTGIYRIECDGQLNGEDGVDERQIEVRMY